MIAILNRALSITLLIALVGCGVRGPLYLPTVPPVPPAPLEPEPKGALYPPQTPATTGNPSSVKQ
ncbi:lipoprotein [Polynucleobacter sp.]|uniref:LPS translocon maturation chaperone LptM n=1 Tax=Polynucleobacter sp. TaxID=2029855 RepID=UPI0030159771